MKVQIDFQPAMNATNYVAQLAGIDMQDQASVYSMPNPEVAARINASLS